MTANRFRFRAWIPKTNKMLMHESIITYPIYELSVLSDVSGFIWMQSTGLVDKNGKEIFEGDIIQVKPPSHTTSWGASRFLPHLVEWRLLDSIEPSENMVGFDLPQDWQQMEIVGNIYENGDLLK